MFDTETEGQRKRDSKRCPQPHNPALLVTPSKKDYRLFRNPPPRKKSHVFLVEACPYPRKRLLACPSGEAFDHLILPLRHLCGEGLVVRDVRLVQKLLWVWVVGFCVSAFVSHLILLDEANAVVGPGPVDAVPEALHVVQLVHAVSR